MNSGVFCHIVTVYKIKHLGMQSGFTNNTERMGHSKELPEFEHGNAIEYYHFDKSVSEISSHA